MNGVDPKRVNRRELIKAALAAGGAVYVAPMILSRVTPVSAQGVSGNPHPECIGQTCAHYVSACSSSNPDCICVSTSTGGGACLPGSTPCSGLPACGAGNTCAAGSICVVNTCCSGPVCVSAALLAACAADPEFGIAPPPPSGSGPTLAHRAGAPA